MSGGGRVRQTGLLLATLIALGTAIWLFPSPGPVISDPAIAPGSANGRTPATVSVLAAPAQSALDRILGPGRSVVTASATYGAASRGRSTVYDPRHVVVLEQSRITAPGYQGSVSDNGVSRTVTDSSTGGKIQRISVAVVIDSNLRPAPKLTTIRQTVTAALGLRSGRSDTLTVTRAPISAAPNPISAAGTRSTSVTTTASVVAPAATAARITAYVPSAFGAGVVLVLLLTLARDGASRRRRLRR
jgi:hypothetical protein